MQLVNHYCQSFGNLRLLKPVSLNAEKLSKTAVSLLHRNVGL